MKHPFVPYEIANALKEKGFNLPCLACYDKLNMLSTYSTVFEPKNYNNSGYCCSAPLYQEVIDWLDNNFHCLIYYSPYLSKEPRRFELFIWYRGETINIGLFNSLKSGYDKSIEEALKLI